MMESVSPGVAALIAGVLGYLLGSIPASYVAGRVFGDLDLREVGSGNLGATNVFRNLGAGPAAIVLIVDVGKGALAVWLGIRLLPDVYSALPDLTGLICAIAAILGHTFSPFVGFRGGKGVATAAGAFVVMTPLPLISAMLVWTALLLTTRVMSVASIAGAVVLPVNLALVEILRPEGESRRWATLILGTIVAAWVILRHRPNIQRLREGQETRLW